MSEVFTGVMDILAVILLVVGRLIEEGKLRAFRYRDGGPWHVLLDSVAEYEQQLRAQYGLEARANAAGR